MTEKEAIREVVHDYRELRKVTDSDSARGIVINEAYAMAIRALDKQKSRQIITRDTRCPWHCPVCDADQSPATIPSRSAVSIICGRFGQEMPTSFR